MYNDHKCISQAKLQEGKMKSISLKIGRAFLLTTFITCIIFSLVFYNRASNFYYYKSPFFHSLRSRSSKPETYFPGMFLKHNQPSKKGYCEFNYNLPYDFATDEENINFPPELGKSSQLKVMYNVIQAKENSSTPKVSYCTHLTPEFLGYIPELLRYWDGFLSVAAFVPDSDAGLLLGLVNQLCYCDPEMARVSLHFVFPKKRPPSKDIFLERPQNCALINTEQLVTFRTYDNNTYPVNVCRNVARTGAITDFVMVSDIQLMPRLNMAKSFLNMIRLTRFNSILNPRVVFVVPIFEVEKDEDIPTSKEALLALLRTEKAVYFHGLVCKHCQRFPGLELWLESHTEILQPMKLVKREVPYHRWEPIYIGTNNEPLYNEVLTWEGLQDKMLQMLEMCLMQYKFIVLDGTFLVHWPGIKKNKVQEETWRKPFHMENCKQYSKILKELSSKYTNNPRCKIK